MITPSKLSALPALRRQHLLVEFAGLKQACPEGVFMSLTPGDPSLWSGVIFVRDGPYAPAVLRTQISFPDSYPRLPPLVTLSTDVFHPLITPLSTYTYSTDVQDNGTVSATDVERLPPGGFSLTHGFPEWFGRRVRVKSAPGDKPSTEQQEPRQTPHRPPPPVSSTDNPSSTRVSAVGDSPGFAETRRKGISTFEMLRYIRSTFDDEDILDSIPLEAAGNPGAWHAWRSHRMDQGKEFSDLPANQPNEIPEASASTNPGSVKKPGQWNWEGVWEERVKKGIAASLSESVMFGDGKINNDVIRFLNMEADDVDAIKENLMRTLDQAS